jgi:hypothetical protein
MPDKPEASDTLVQLIPILVMILAVYLYYKRDRIFHKKWSPVSLPISEEGQVTRLLCASAYLDPFWGYQTFRRRMTRFYDRSRAVAPEVGYDVRAVLLCCEAASARAEIYAYIFLLITIITGLLFNFLGWTVLLYGILLSCTLAYVKVFNECANITRKFRAENYQSSAALSLPKAKPDFGIDDKLPSAGQNLIIYGGYLPFVGLGSQLDRWSFSAFMDKPKDGCESSDIAQFSIEELYAAIDNGIESLSLKRVHNEEWYFMSGAVGHEKEEPLRELVDKRHQRLPSEIISKIMSSTNSGRRMRAYKWIRIDDWGGDLVFSDLLRCSKLGNSLFVESCQFLLPPIASKYRLLDCLPEGGRALHSYCLAESLRKGIVMLIASPLVVVLNLIQRLAKWRERNINNMKVNDVWWNNNYGSLTSARVAIADKNYQHFFQELDTDFYRKVVEKKILDTIIEFLDRRNINTTDIRERRTTILNSGILIQRGDVRAESLAVGHGATSTKVVGAEGKVSA